MDYVAAGIQRKKEFEDTLLGLMQEMPYEKITVKDLTERMHFARKTFYHYFPGKQTCLESLIDRVIFECNMYELQTVPKEPDAAHIYTARLKFWMENRSFLQTVIQNGLDSFLLSRIMRYIHSEDLKIREQMSTPKVKYDEDILFFYLSGEVFLLLKWCQEGFALPLEEMVRKLVRLSYEPLLTQL